MTSDALDKFNSKVFSEHVNTKFRVSTKEGNSLLLELIDVVEKDTSPKMELFSVHFRGPNTPRLPQQIYHLEHDQLGGFDLFLTAVAGDAQSTDYEAVFHRFRKPQA